MRAAWTGTRWSQRDHSERALRGRRDWPRVRTWPDACGVDRYRWSQRDHSERALRGRRDWPRVRTWPDACGVDRYAVVAARSQRTRTAWTPRLATSEDVAGCVRRGPVPVVAARSQRTRTAWTPRLATSEDV